MVIQFPCGICSKAVANNHQAIKYDKCNLWIHIKCDKINKQTYNYLNHILPTVSAYHALKNLFLSQLLRMESLPMQLLVKKIKVIHVPNTPNSIRENFIQAINSEN